MIPSILEFTNHLNDNGGGHILYFTDEVDEYVKNAVDFIVTGVKNGEYVLFVENDPITRLVSTNLNNVLSNQELEKIQFINNFDFYCSTGNFHIMTILTYFFDTLDPYFNQNVKIRCWGHVEWPTHQHVDQALKEFEFEIDRLMPEMDIIGICAYNRDRLTKETQQELMTCHGYFMTDQDIGKLVHEDGTTKRVF
ncbi:MEDS domain-containing protein [Bacillus weihaiensis]|uniref:MEDS domain-containing protein n=1 Tax=Bacillus weihaiensis TaxID=1547283 RepID=A0A1L3MTR1_9BACI|nr:MEDS domain-containing protein [Bacillus weihaiensis]APH05722.1 hypothetical protein A9C19_13825 [Bacillus weihaiensis]